MENNAEFSFLPFFCSFLVLFICLPVCQKRFVVIKYCEKKKLYKVCSFSHSGHYILNARARMSNSICARNIFSSSSMYTFLLLLLFKQTTKKRQKLISFLALDIKHPTTTHTMYSSFLCQIKEGSLGKATLFFGAHSYNNAL